MLTTVTVTSSIFTCIIVFAIIIVVGVNTIVDAFMEKDENAIVYLIIFSVMFLCIIGAIFFDGF